MDRRELEKNLWTAAKKLRHHSNPGIGMHRVLGLVFLRYITDVSFEAKESLVKNEVSTSAAQNKNDEEYLAYNEYFVPKNAQWNFLQSHASHPNIGILIDEAIDSIEKLNENLRGIFLKDYADPDADKQGLGELVDLVGTIGSGKQSHRQKESLSHAYEYLLEKFAETGDENADPFYTPQSIVKLLAEMTEPRKGKIYDGCCGTGSMFVQSVKWIKKYRGKIENLSFYGQDRNPVTVKIAKMNMAIHGLDANLQCSDTFTSDCHPSLTADYILSHPPFKSRGWKGDPLQDDKRWKYGVPPEENADYAWLQHLIYKLAPTGTAGIVLKNSSSNSGGVEGEIRKSLIENNLIDCKVALPSGLLSNTNTTACLWILTRNKTHNTYRNAKEILFIDAGKLTVAGNGRNRELTDENIIQIARTYQRWKNINGDYTDIKGFCRAVSIEKVRKNGYALSPGKYVRGRSVKAVLPAMLLIILFAFLYFAGFKNGLFTAKPKTPDTAITVQPEILKDSIRPEKKLSKTAQKEANKQQAEVKDSPVVVADNHPIETKDPVEADTHPDDTDEHPDEVKDNSAIVINKPDEIKPPAEEVPQPEAKNGDEIIKYKVNSTAYFYDRPDESSRRRAYITHWNNSYADIQALDEKNDFIYVVFTNHLNQTSRGWLRKKDLKEIKQ